VKNKSGQIIVSDNFGGNSFILSVQNEFWKHWLDRGLWDYREAIRLIVCGARGCISQCVEDVKWREERENCECFFEAYNDISSDMRKFFELYTNEDWKSKSFEKFPYKIAPKLFVEWALSKRTVIIPKEMKDWYYQQPKNYGGCNKETDKIKATSTACTNVEAMIIQSGNQFLDNNQKIGIDEFGKLVKESMSANNTSDKLQQATIRRFYNNSILLAPFKRRRGQKKK